MLYKELKPETITYIQDCAKAILAGCYKFGSATLLRHSGATMTSVVERVCNELKIRKLTERECFRLMGVDDKYIDIIQSVVLSKSARYKLAGNSIVVDVLFHIFRKLLIEQSSESKELNLFN